MGLTVRDTTKKVATMRGRRSIENGSSAGLAALAGMCSVATQNRTFPDLGLVADSRVGRYRHAKSAI